MTAPGYDVRPYPGRGAALVVSFARDLFGAVAGLDAVGGDLVVASGRALPGVALVRHPDLIRDLLIAHDDDTTKARGLRLARSILGDGLLTSEPPTHTRQRRLVLPAFHHQRLRAYADAMVSATNAESDLWANGQRLDAAAAMSRLTLSIAGRTLFSADVLAQADPVGQAIAETMAAFERSQFPFADRLMWLPTPAVRRTRRARAVLDALVYRLIADRRRATPDEGGDLLDLLLAATDEESGHGMTDDEVRDEVLTLLLAGHETTAVALTWTWAALAAHPDAEAAFHDEIDALGSTPNVDHLADLPVTRAIVAESLRLWPPAWAVGREAARPFDLGGAPIARGTTLLFAPYHLHRDGRFWESPESFDPSRFLSPADRHKFAYLPFSAGRRGCIGERFAWMEAVLVLATLGQRWRLIPDGPAPAKQGSVTLRPAGPMPVRVEAR